mmetsp:Transcript_19103/g.53942  ORF Transcript_19103/g.53942 Transcript_19103/m.53942 type:complete len:203 (+) Transcript_19103:351-959(+)
MNLSAMSCRWSLLRSHAMALWQFFIKHWNKSGRLDMLSMMHCSNRSQPVVCASFAFCASNSSMRAGAWGIVLPSMPSMCCRASVVWSWVPLSVSLAVRRRAAKKPVVGALRPPYVGGLTSTWMFHLSNSDTGSRSSKSSGVMVRSLPEPGAISSHSPRISWSCGCSFSERRRLRLWRLPPWALVSAEAWAMSLPRRCSRGSL